MRGDPALAGVVADAECYLCLMHMQGAPRTMQTAPTYHDVASEVASFLEQRLRFAVDAGVDEERICLDPGIGFGKTVEQNLELVSRLDVLLRLGRPVLIGLSRKSSLGRVLGDPLARTGFALSVARRRRRRVRAWRDGPPRSRREGARRSADGGARDRVIVEIHGLELFGRHGVGEAERRDGQTFLFDVTLELPEPARDSIDATVDYRRVRDIVRGVSDGRALRIAGVAHRGDGRGNRGRRGRRRGNGASSEAGDSVGGLDCGDRDAAHAAALNRLVRAYVGLGSNLGDREVTLRGAVERLGTAPGVHIVALSTLRETEPVGPVTDQPAFLNGVVELETSLNARELLALLLAVEAGFGRTRNGPRRRPEDARPRPAPLRRRADRRGRPSGTASTPPRTSVRPGASGGAGLDPTRAGLH